MPGFVDALLAPAKVGVDFVADVAADVVTADNSFGALTRQVVGSDATTWADQRQATEDADAQREALGIGSAAGSAGSTLVMDNFDAMTHEEMLLRTDKISAEAIDATARAWSGVSERLTQAVETFRTTIASAIGSGWEGSAAAAASSRVSVASTDLGKLSDEAANVARNLSEAQVGFQEAQRKMPPTTDRPSILSSVVNPFSLLLKNEMHERNELREEALVVLKGVYAPTALQTDAGWSGLKFEHARQWDPGTITPSISGGDSSSWVGGDGTTPPGVNGNNTPSGGDSANGDGSVPADVANGDTSDQSTGTDGYTDAQVSPSSYAADNAWTTPASASNATGPAGAYGPSAGSGYGAGSGTGAGGSGYGAGGFGGGSGSSGVPGGVAMPGGVAAPMGAASSASPAAAAAGRPGAPGMGMAPPAARGAGGDDDSEHATPGYLVNADNGNELVGALPLVAPPVLGA